MMRASGKTEDGRPLLVIGLEAGNIVRLKAGQPIRFDMAPHGITGDCVIVFGETADDCASYFTPLGNPKVKGSS